MANSLENREYDELMSNPQITEIQSLVAKNTALATIIGKQHTTQAFSTAGELSTAFQGKLTRAGAIGEHSAELAKVEHRELIKSAGITDKDLENIFQQVWIYSRLTNPTNELLEEAISKIEGAEKTAVFASGLAAIDAAVRQFVSPGSAKRGHYQEGGKILAIGSIYGGTYAQMIDTCRETGRRFDHLSISEFLEKGLSDDTAMVFCETSNNPTLRVAPLKRIVAEAKRVKAMTLCDNTFTPLTVRPREIGIDLTVTSMTKYFNGKSEDLGGCVSGKGDLIGKFLDLHSGRRMLGGAVMAPRVAKEFLERLSTLPHRLLKATLNASAIKDLALQAGLPARTIENYPEYAEIRNNSIPQTISNGMVSLFMEDAVQAQSLVDSMISCGVGVGAVSLGAEGTYFCLPGQTTHSEIPADELAKIGITPGLIRISCGIEPDLIDRFKEVLNGLSQ